MHISFSQLVGLKQFNATFTESRNENVRKITRKIKRKIGRKTFVFIKKTKGQGKLLSLSGLTIAI